MTSQSKAHDQARVILGLHSGDHLDVFIRDGARNLHQAARITTHNGLDPAALTSIMADLADAFGWQQIASAPVVPHSPELPRGNRAGVPATPARGPKPKRGRPPKNQPPPPSYHRRDKAAMQLQEDTIIALLDNTDRTRALTTSEIADHVCATLGLDRVNSDANLRKHITRLFEDGRISRTVDPTTLASNGKPRHRWYGQLIVPTALTVDQHDGHAAEFAIDGDAVGAS